MVVHQKIFLMGITNHQVAGKERKVYNLFKNKSLQLKNFS